MSLSIRAGFACALFGFAGLLSAQPLLDPDPLKTFDGRDWSGLSVGRDTDSDIKKKFKTEKGAVRPEALKFVADRGATVRVDALLDGRGGKAVMRAIRVEYLGRGPSIMDLVDAWDERPVEMYQKGRTEDWRVEFFEKRGVIAVVIGSGSREQVPVFILTDPDRIPVVEKQFVDGPTPIEKPFDPGANWDGLVRYNFANVNVDIDGSRPEWMNKRWQDDLRESLQFEARSYRGEPLRAGGNTGNLTINMTTNRFSDESASFKVTLSLFTKTPYGDLSRFTNESRTIERNHRARAVELLRAALRELDDEVQRVVRGYGPEPVEAARGRAMEAMYKAASGA